MMRNCRKMSKTVALARAAATSSASFDGAGRVMSLMALGWISFQAINHRRFRYAERKPVLHFLLQAHVELGGKYLLFVGDIFSARELQLEGELSDELFVFASRAPQTDVALSYYAFAEVQLAEWKQHFFHNAFVYQRDMLIG